MRIALVAHSDAPWTGHYLRGLEARGHDLRLFSFCPDRVAGVEPVFLGSLPYNPARRKHLFVSRAPRLRRLLKQYRPDLVFATYLISNGLTAALAWRGPLLVSARGADVLEQAGRRPVPAPFHGPMVRFICGRARSVHAVSEELADALVAFGIPRSKIESFPVGVDLSVFGPRSRPGDPEAVPRIVCTRKHEAVYENHVLVDALRDLKNRGVEFRALFVGGGSLLEDTRSRVADRGLGGRVEVRGPVPHEEIPRLLAGSDIYVSCSSSDGTSSSLLEALACGLFPVVSWIKANETWVREGETGLLFPPGDNTRLAEALERALLDRALLRGAQRANRQLVEERGDLDANLTRLEGLLEESC